MKFWSRVLLLIALLVSGCTGLPALSPLPAKTSTPAIATLSLDTSLPEPTPSPTPGPLKLRIWVPPQFDPAAGTPAGDLLQARLNEFSKRRSNIGIEVRVKAVYGPGGLLDALSTATVAAPLALPDLVALPRDVLETAALKGLLHPLDNQTQALDNSDWYEYAKQLAHVQKNTFGLPFAGDAMALIYRPTVIPAPSANLTNTLQLKKPLAFPAADVQALFTLALYQANGGAVQDQEGRPFLDMAALLEVFQFYAQAEQAGVAPYSLTQYQNDDQTWEAFTDKQADQVVAWCSRYLAAQMLEEGLPPDIAMTSLPTLDGAPYTLATGWVWASTTPHKERLELSIELAEFLTDSSFLAGWTEAVGYLPPRPSALNAWANTDTQAVLSQIALSAHLYPSMDILTNLSTPLSQAVVQVIKKQNDPVSAAQTVIQSLSGP